MCLLGCDKNDVAYIGQGMYYDLVIGMILFKIEINKF